jgi:ribose transport system substrate-binding protein
MSTTLRRVTAGLIVGAMLTAAIAVFSASAPAAKQKKVPFTGSVENGVPVGFAKPKPAKVTIGFSTAVGGVESLDAVEAAARLETKKLGGTFISLDAKGNPDKQVSDIQQLIARKVDAIVFTPLDTNALLPVAKQAKAAGIPVFGMDINVKSKKLPPGFTGQVWQRRDTMAYLEAKEAARVMPAGSGFGQIGYAVKVALIEFGNARVKYWGEKFGLKALGQVNAKEADATGGNNAMTQLMSQAPKMKGVIACCDQYSIGAQSAARAAGKKYVQIGANGGSDGLGAVRAKKIHSTVQLQSPDIGRFLTWGAYDAAAGHKVPTTVMTGAPILVTARNINSVRTWDQVLKQRYGKSG